MLRRSQVRSLKDIVAIPDFAAGAMENWGLITFRESSLLYDDASSSNADKQYVTYVIAHELAHQWFGNLVTMNWWNELWLNEGFATFVGKLIGTDHVNPDDSWPVKEDFRADMATSLETDGLLTSHPLSLDEDKVLTLADIESMFDSITYVKGSGIVNMLYNYVGKNVTQSALQDYLTSHSYGNAMATDLWSAFDKAYNHPSEPNKISSMMNTWSSASGHPFLTAKVSRNQVAVTQKQFYLCKTCNKTGHNSSLWNVPIKYSTYGMKPTSGAVFLLEGESGTVKPDKKKFEKVLLNVGWNGYYHVNYTGESLVDINAISDIELANIVEDNMLLFRAGEVVPKDFVKFLKNAVASSKAGYLTWRMLLRCSSYLLNIYASQYDNYAQVSNLIYSWLDVQSMNVSYTSVNASSIRDRTILSGKLAIALSINHERVLKDVEGLKDLTELWYSSVLNDSVDTSQDIHKDIARQVWTCGFLSYESNDLWTTLWTKYKDSDVPSDQQSYMLVLASGSDNALLNRMLRSAVSDARDEDTIKIISLVAANRRARVDSWVFVKANWDVFIERYADQGFAMARLIKATTMHFSDQYKLNDMQSFFGNGRNLGAGRRAANQSLEIVEANVFMMKSLSAKLLEAVKKENPSQADESSS